MAKKTQSQNNTNSKFQENIKDAIKRIETAGECIGKIGKGSDPIDLEPTLSEMVLNLESLILAFENLSKEKSNEKAGVYIEDAKENIETAGDELGELTKFADVEDLAPALAHYTYAIEKFCMALKEMF